jgi:hypothetical protein
MDGCVQQAIDDTPSQGLKKFDGSIVRGKFIAIIQSFSSGWNAPAF